MKTVITEEAHNHVMWEMKTSLLWIEVGAFIAGLCVMVLLAMTPSPLRWTLAGSAGVIVICIGAVLVLTMPLAERGELERTVDGGTVVRSTHWLVRRQRVTSEMLLETVHAFRSDARLFTDVGDETYTLSRLVAVLTDARVVPLTDWLEPQFVHRLGEALAKAGRCEFEAG